MALAFPTRTTVTQCQQRMRDRQLTPILFATLLLLLPIAWLATKFDPYQLDGDAVSFMDLADLIHHHDWAAAVNGYWNPLYPACLALAQTVLHPKRWNELGAYYAANFVIFLACLAAAIVFTDALIRLRNRLWPDAMRPLLTQNAMRLFAVALVVIGATRELSMGKMRSDALLEALLLAAFALWLRVFAAERLLRASTLALAALMGLAFGLAYLTKSFAFPVTLLSVAVLVLFAWIVQRRKFVHTMLPALVALTVFAAVAGPYVTALSRQKHRLTFGESGALNYAWFVSGTEKFHLEPWMGTQFGSATVTLHHPEVRLLAQPGVYSYAAMRHGTNPYWFDPSYFDDQVTPRFNPHRLWLRSRHNLLQVASYLFNHPEAPLLLLVLLLAGARLATGSLRRQSFWLPAFTVGVAMGVIYGMVNVEERYVTLAYLMVVLPLFAMLRVPAYGDTMVEGEALDRRRSMATAAIVLLVFLALGDMLRIALEHRRLEALGGAANGWSGAPAFTIAGSLDSLGVEPGDSVACMGSTACTYDPYWERLAGVRATEEVFNPDHATLFSEWTALPNQAEVIHTLAARGDKLLVASFKPSELNHDLPQAHGWIRLGGTAFYALPITLHPAVPTEALTPAWGSTERALP
jgi:hypothetical protein